MDLIASYSSDNDEKEEYKDKTEISNLNKDEHKKKRKLEEEEPDPQKKQTKNVQSQQTNEVLTTDTVNREEKNNNIDNSSVHRGRIRSFEHVEGNWPTHVYIQIPISIELQELIEEAKQQLLKYNKSNTNEGTTRASLQWEFVAEPDLHLSLSRTVTLKYHQIPTLVKTLNQTITELKNNLNTPIKLQFEMCNIRFFMNEPKSRSFAALSMIEFEDASENSIFLQLIDCVNQCFRMFSLQEYYSDPQPHVTFAWCLGSINVYSNENLNSSTEISTTRSCTVELNTIDCKIGNKLYSIALD